MSDIQSEIKDLIEKNLPALDAKRLGKYIEDAEKDKFVITTLKAEIEKLQAALGTVTSAKDAKTIQIDGMQRRITEYELREASFKESEIKLIVAGKNIEKAEASRDATLEVVRLFTKNPEIRSVVTRTAVTPIPVVQSGGTYVSNYENKTTEAEVRTSE